MKSMSSAVRLSVTRARNSISYLAPFVKHFFEKFSNLFYIGLQMPSSRRTYSYIGTIFEQFRWKGGMVSPDIQVSVLYTRLEKIWGVATKVLLPIILNKISYIVPRAGLGAADRSGCRKRVSLSATTASQHHTRTEAKRRTQSNPYTNSSNSSKSWSPSGVLCFSGSSSAMMR